MIELLLATALTCHESQEVIDSLKQYQTLSDYREELIEVIKTNTKQVRFYKNKCLRVYTHLLKVLTYSNTCSLTCINSLKHFWLCAHDLN